MIFILPAGTGDCFRERMQITNETVKLGASRVFYFVFDIVFVQKGCFLPLGCFITVLKQDAGCKYIETNLRLFRIN
ncbi:hypothetical protein SAMN05421736_101265 [Evansella caseinilytica]|uniref:Uncharacterized protein n=1 Tax=Evansella caseinilytica TaxID=1503961 RepID=A0A1H3GRV2_9BACI|nr:hypothetical protein SAMN05421736_101265 [Evansella caseinilytica]